MFQNDAPLKATHVKKMKARIRSTVIPISSLYVVKIVLILVIHPPPHIAGILVLKVVLCERLDEMGCLLDTHIVLLNAAPSFEHSNTYNLWYIL